MNYVHLTGRPYAPGEPAPHYVLAATPEREAVSFLLGLANVARNTLSEPRRTLTSGRDSHEYAQGLLERCADKIAELVWSDEYRDLALIGFCPIAVRRPRYAVHSPEMDLMDSVRAESSFPIGAARSI